MEAYTSTRPIINLGSAPDVPELIWTFDRRKRMSLRQCVGKPRYRGRARRHRREVITRQALALLANQPVKGVDLGTHQGAPLTMRTLLYASIPNAPSWALALRMQGRALAQLAQRHGPESGWGIAQPQPAPESATTWTPFYVPKKAEKCWRWWRRVVLFLVRVLTTLARAWSRLVPLHRQRLEGTTDERERSSTPFLTVGEPSRCRDQQGVDWRASAARIAQRIGM
jgi:hypothetical protein